MVLALLVLGSAFAVYYFVFLPPKHCMTLGGERQLKSAVGNSTFGAITEYQLPEPGRMPNGIAVAQDGSVWFGEQSVPGVGHLFGNGTLVEYPWPTASSPTSRSCGYESGIWGMALWNGMVWGTDGDQDALVGVNPQNGATRTINVSGLTTFPYTLSVAPDGSLWFTALGKSPSLGRLTTNYSLSVIPVNGLGREFPTQVDFVNSTYAYFVALDPSKNTGGLYSFDPKESVMAIAPQKVGGSFPLSSPDSVSHGGGMAWVAQHGPSSVAAFDTRFGKWTVFPTSTESYTYTTLPYFVSEGSGKVWFNEHYGNRIGIINVASGTLTEYSEANPPVANASNIQNDLTIALTSGGLWFTSTTGNYIGFVDASYHPPFAISVNGNNSASVAAGNGTAFQLTVSGHWSSQLKVQVSDSEGITAVPKLISVVPGEHTIPREGGRENLKVTISVDSQIKPGRFTVGVTVTDGLVYQTAYLFLTIT